MVVSAVEKGAIIHKKNKDNKKSKVELESFCK